jgi:hypothetical protein
MGEVQNSVVMDKSHTLISGQGKQAKFSSDINTLEMNPGGVSHYTTAVAEDGKSWFSDGFFLGKGMILCSEKHVPPSVKN